MVEDFGEWRKAEADVILAPGAFSSSPGGVPSHLGCSVSRAF